MCGIYGFCGRSTPDTQLKIKQLGILNESRGHDSTGLAVIGDRKCTIYKKAVNSTRFFNEFSNVVDGSIYNNLKFLTVLGHTRLATHGAVTDKNAHPFKVGNTVFTHNGIISNFEELQKEYSTMHEVDSQIIGNILEENDNKAFKNLAGMFTVPFVNMQEPDMLQVAVHNQVFAFAYKGNQLYYSSDIRHLKQVLKGQGFQICRGANDVLYKFYLINKKEFAIAHENIQAKKTVYYTYPYSSYGWEADEYFRDTPNVRYNWNSKSSKKWLDKTAKSLRVVPDNSNSPIDKKDYSKKLWDRWDY